MRITRHCFHRSFCCFCSSAHFAPIATKTESDIMNTTSIYANCLRRLLAMYVCGKCCTSGASIQKRYVSRMMTTTPPHRPNLRFPPGIGCRRVAPHQWEVGSLSLRSICDLRSSWGFWMECLKEVRVHWENRLPIRRLHPPTPILRPHASPRKEGVVGRINAETPLWSAPLWDDVIEKYRASGTPFSCLDLSQCLVFQKRQV